MSHRQRWTHELAAQRRVQAGEDDYGSPTHDTEDVVGGSASDPEPVRFRPGGTEYVRGETGERAQRAPTAAGRARLGDLLEEGDTITLTPLAPDADPIEDVQVAGIEETYGRTARPTATIVELESV